MKKLSNEDLIGMQFNKLTILEINHVNGRDKAFCECECGKHTYTPRVLDVVRGHTQSCGCLSKHRKKNVKSGVTWDSDRKKFRAYYGAIIIGHFFMEEIAQHALDHYIKKIA